jgi:hypothetical protein
MFNAYRSFEINLSLFLEQCSLWPRLLVLVFPEVTSVIFTILKAIGIGGIGGIGVNRVFTDRMGNRAGSAMRAEVGTTKNRCYAGSQANGVAHS